MIFMKLYENCMEIIWNCMKKKTMKLNEKCIKTMKKNNEKYIKLYKII